MHNKDLSGFEDIITHYTIMGNDMDSAISTFAKNYKGIQNSITSNYSNGR
ncbi:hypothetical protein [Periweissella cryptocerci]|nr:hypothetical protein [Periweissella cryptocerci]